VIAKTITSILSAGMLPQRVIVINDASKDRTAEIARSFGVVVIDNPVNLGKAGGVTNALRSIFSDPRYKDLTHVCFLDADTLVDQGYFSAVRKRLAEDLKETERYAKRGKRRKSVGILCGRAKSIPHNWLTAFRAYELWQSQSIHKTAQAKFRTITVAPGCASTYSVDVLRFVKWSDETVTEDMDSTIQVALQGERIEYEPDAVVYTQDPQTIRDYLGQTGKRWYPGTWQVMGKHGLLWRGLFSRLHWECRLAVLEPVVFLLMLLHTLVFKPQNLPYALGAVFFFVFTMATLASWRERRTDILKYAVIFPIISIVNLVVFVGSAWNLFGKNRNRRRDWYSPQRYDIVTKQ
jgi:cellulose synthase/poly-beta-1,6-N-acetylglucosamine synthase-like glycosyltransferase